MLLILDSLLSQINRKDVKTTAEEISVWNPIVAFYQNPGLIPALRITVGKVNIFKWKAKPMENCGQGAWILYLHF